jgi:hypothetical protein
MSPSLYPTSSMRVFSSWELYHTEAVFKEKRKIWYPMLELTIASPYLIDESEVQLSVARPINADECFPNYSKIKQPIGKGRVLV